MSSMAVADLVTVSETGSEQLSASLGLAPVKPPAAAQRDGLRPLEVAQCSLCGIARPHGLLVPDGGQACADVRWYCKDAKSCTERWTAAHASARAHPRAVPGTAVAGAEAAAPDAASTEPLDGVLEKA
jgi:hypothetical protein